MNEELESCGACLVLAPIAIAFVVGMTFLQAWVLMVAWNFVVPAVFGLTAITFWQAFAFAVILSLLGGVSVKNRS